MIDVEKMAREAGLTHLQGSERMWVTEQCDGVIDGGLIAFAQAVARRCAEICGAQEDYAVDVLICEASRRSAADCADAIRAEFGIEGE